MREPVPGVEHTDDRDKELQQKVAEESTKAGHHVTAADVNPSPDSHLENIGDFVGKTTAHAVNYVSGDKGLLAPDETVPGRKGVFRLKERLRRLVHRK